MNAERVFQAEHDDEAESLRLWAWFAIKQAGGKVVVPYDNFFTCQGGRNFVLEHRSGDLDFNYCDRE